VSIDSSTNPTPTETSPPDSDTTITVIAWRDNLIENHPESHPTSSSETLIWWTPTLGPTATLMVHRLAGYVASRGEQQFTLGDLARTFGMGQSTSRVRAALDRLERFGIISVTGQTVSVRLAMPPLTQRHIAKLPGYLAELYEQRRRTQDRPTIQR